MNAAGVKNEKMPRRFWVSPEEASEEPRPRGRIKPFYIAVDTITVSDYDPYPSLPPDLRSVRRRFPEKLGIKLDFKRNADRK